MATVGVLAWKAAELAKVRAGGKAEAMLEKREGAELIRIGTILLAVRARVGDSVAILPGPARFGISA